MMMYGVALFKNTIWTSCLFIHMFLCIIKTKPTYDNVFNMRYLDMVVSETLRMHPPATRYVYTRRSRRKKW